MPQTILITGSTNGIGYQTALLLACQGHNIIVASRSEEKVNHIVKEIRRISENSNVYGFQVNLADLKSVKSFVDKLKVQYDHLNIVILNAGISGPRDKQLNDANHEITFATNHLGHFYLLQNILDLLKPSSRRSRIVVISSGLHYPNEKSGRKPPTFDLDMWKNPITYAHMDAYANSKLANAIYGQYLSRTLDPKNITVVTYAPGFIGDTGLMNAGLLQPLVKVMVEIIIWFNSWWNDIPNVISTLERSCNFICRLATEDEYVKDTGRYYSIDHTGEANPDAYDISKQEQLVAFSLRLINEAGFDINK